MRETIAPAQTTPGQKAFLNVAEDCAFEDVTRYGGQDNFTDSERRIAQEFEERLAGIRPYMFSMAAQLLDAYPERQWNLIIGDDTGGRLPTRFARKCLELHGIKIPTQYIMAGGNARRNVDSDKYEQYLEHISSSHPHSRALIVTETAATYATVHTLQELFETHDHTVDIASVSARTDPDPSLGHVIVGAISDTSNEEVRGALEDINTGNKALGVFNVLRKLAGPRLRGLLKPVLPAPPQPTGHPTTNLDNRPIYNLPVAKLHPDRSHARLARYCYQRMDELAVEFTAARNQPTKDELGVRLPDVVE